MPSIGFPAVIISVLAVYWMAASLFVSWWIYDRSGLYALDWLNSSLGKTPVTWVQVHAGYDPFAPAMRELWPKSRHWIVDVGDEARMPEGSLRRARGEPRESSEAVNGKFDHLPVPSASCDAAFVLMAAHELRQHEERRIFFRELSRVLTDGGDLIVLEHTRGFWNWLAFGPAALHFFSAAEWAHLGAEEVGPEGPATFVTPFVRVFRFRKKAVAHA